MREKKHIEVEVGRFLNRVIESEDVVSFSYTDAYGHLSTCRHLEIFVNHRILAPQLRFGLASMELAKSGVGLFFTESNVKYHSPAPIGAKLKVCSWVSAIYDKGFSVKGVISDSRANRVCSVVSGKIAVVDLKSGGAKAMPSSFPCSFDRVDEHPHLEEWLDGTEMKSFLKEDLLMKGEL